MPEPRRQSGPQSYMTARRRGPSALSSRCPDPSDNTGSASGETAEAVSPASAPMAHVETTFTPGSRVNLEETGSDTAIAAFLSRGAALAGSASQSAGVGSGIRAPSFPGVASDWLAIRALRIATADLAERALSTRESARAAALVALTAERLCDNLTAGRPVRQDGFFDPGTSAGGDQFVEAALTAATRDVEVRKLPHV